MKAHLVYAGDEVPVPLLAGLLALLPHLLLGVVPATVAPRARPMAAAGAAALLRDQAAVHPGHLPRHHGGPGAAQTQVAIVTVPLTGTRVIGH